LGVPPPQATASGCALYPSAGYGDAASIPHAYVNIMLNVNNFIYVLAPLSFGEGLGVRPPRKG